MGSEMCIRDRNFPLQEVTKPIVWRLAHDFGLKFSIRRASIDIRTGGFTVLELTGPEDKIAQGLEWARSEGIETNFVGMDGTDEWATLS